MSTPKELLKSLIQTSNLFQYECIGKPETKKYNLFKKIAIEYLTGCILGHKHHHKYKGYFDLGSFKERRNKLQKFRGMDTFDHFNNQIQIWNMAKPYIQGVCNQGWALTPVFQKQLDSLIPLAKSKKLLQYTKWSTCMTETYDKESQVTPSISKMNLFFNDAKNSTEDRLIMWSYLTSFHLHNGVIPQYYIKGNKNGVYYPRGALALTNMKKDIRDTIMAGYYQYDIQSAVFSILLELINNSNRSQVFPTIHNYCQNTKKIRNQVASTTGIDYESVKQCFLTIGFGGSLTSWGAISNIVPICYLNKFRKEPVVVRFLSELKILTSELTKQFPTELQQVKDARKNPNGQYNNKFRCLLYQRKLNEILEAIADLAVNSNDALYVYDAIYIKDKLSLQDVIQQVKIDTGLNLLFSRTPD